MFPIVPPLTTNVYRDGSELFLLRQPIVHHIVLYGPGCNNAASGRGQVKFALSMGTPSLTKIGGLTAPTLLSAVRTTTAAVAGLLLARLLKLPEFYWAPISAIVVIESTIDAKTIAWQRFAGTALGAGLAALVGTFFSNNVIVYAAAIFLCGAICAILRLQGAYRFAAITISIVLLIAHSRPSWIVAVHRCVEVSLGIAVGLVLALTWPIPTQS